MSSEISCNPCGRVRFRLRRRFFLRFRGRVQHTAAPPHAAPTALPIASTRVEPITPMGQIGTPGARLCARQRQALRALQGCSAAGAARWMRGARRRKRAGVIARGARGGSQGAAEGKTAEQDGKTRVADGTRQQGGAHVVGNEDLHRASLAEEAQLRGARTCK